MMTVIDKELINEGFVKDTDQVVSVRPSGIDKISIPDVR